MWTQILYLDKAYLTQSTYLISKHWTELNNAAIIFYIDLNNSSYFPY